VNAALLLIEALGRARASHPRHTDPFLGEDTWNLGVFRAGDENPNIVPASAFATIDYRLVGHTEDELRNWWMSQPGVAHVETVLSLPAVHTPADDPWVGTLPAPLSAEPCSYFTDGSVLTGLWPRTPIVVWGPGAPQQMHADNEQIAVSEVEGIVEAYVTAAVQTEASGN
jgi:succinyl-diaminopimelate desuccinylase